MNSNPFAEIYERLHNIEGLLLAFDERLPDRPAPTPNPDRWEQGVNIAAEELGWKNQTVYQNIDKLPHRKLHGKLYFNRVELQKYIAEGGHKV